MFISIDFHILNINFHHYDMYANIGDLNMTTKAKVALPSEVPVRMQKDLLGCPKYK